LVETRTEKGLIKMLDWWDAVSALLVSAVWEGSDSAPGVRGSLKTWVCKVEGLYWERPSCRAVSCSCQEAWRSFHKISQDAEGRISCNLALAFDLPGLWVCRTGPRLCSDARPQLCTSSTGGGAETREQSALAADGGAEAWPGPAASLQEIMPWVRAMDLPAGTTGRGCQ
jgi:hypothetical protein